MDFSTVYAADKTEKITEDDDEDGEDGEDDKDVLLRFFGYSFIFPKMAAYR